MNPKEEKKFAKVLGRGDVIALAFGAAIGWGWVVMSGVWLITAGTAGSILGFLIGGIMISFVGMTYAELCPALPNCGGECVFSFRALGYRWSFICSWALTLCYLGVVAYEACAFPAIVSLAVPSVSASCKLYSIAGFDIHLPYLIVGLVSACIITAINYRGVKIASLFQKGFVFIILAAGLILIISAFIFGNNSNLEPAFSNGVRGTLSVAVMTPFYMVGFDVVPQASEEINFPAKKLGKLMLVSIIISSLWYCIILLAVSRSLSNTELRLDQVCTADALQKLWGGLKIGKVIIVLGGLAGIISSWNAFIVAGSRVLFSMSEMNMLPKWFRKIHTKYRTPSNAIIFLGSISCIALFFGKVMLMWLSNAGSLAAVIAYGLVAVSFLVLRIKEPDLPRPYRIRHGRLVGTIAVLLCAGMFSLYFPGMPSGLKVPELIIVGIWIILGIICLSLARKRKGT